MRRFPFGGEGAFGRIFKKREATEGIDDASILSFCRYVIAHAGLHLAKALGLLFLASASESLSLLLIGPVIGFLSPTKHVLEFAAPKFLRSLVPGLHIIHLGLVQALVGFLILITLRAIAVRYKDIEVTDVLYVIVNDLRIRLFKSISSAKWGYLARLRSSDLSHALTADIERIQTATTQLLMLIQAVVMVSIYAAISLVISPLMTFFAFAVGIGILILLHPIRRRAKAYGKVFLTQRRDQYAVVNEFLAGMKLAKAYNAEPAYVGRLAAGLHTLKDDTLKYLRVSSLASMTFQIATAAAVAAFVALSFLVVHISRDRIIILLVLFLRIGPRIMALQNNVQDILVNLGSFGSMRRLEIACAENGESNEESQLPAPILTRGIVFDGVDFGYSGSDGLALSDIRLVIPAGQTTAIISPSGGGKSTLADLVLGLLEPQRGCILIDDLVLEGEQRRRWRSQVAYVPQEVFLLNDTVAANLRMAAPEASDQDLWAALAAARVDQVVRDMNEGLGTLLGDRGIRLSGGERQRVALARALLRKPQLLLLDEATSALDWENQAAVARVISGLRGRHTVITIAHRPSMIQFADWVIALDHGAVVESGPFAELANNPSSHLARLLAAESH